MLWRDGSNDLACRVQSAGRTFPTLALNKYSLRHFIESTRLQGKIHCRSPQGNLPLPVARICRPLWCLWCRSSSFTASFGPLASWTWATTHVMSFAKACILSSVIAHRDTCSVLCTFAYCDDTTRGVSATGYMIILLIYGLQQLLFPTVGWIYLS